MREQVTKQNLIPMRVLAPRITHHASVVLSLAVLVSRIDAAEVEASKLPPAATAQIDFDRDVRPIFQQSCIRCHGPEKPKSHFRLTDRAAALKGGDNNPDDIVPGDSARSRLIHYVARVAEDLEMPPLGKGEPLTDEQIGVLRAWIDQGAKWGGAGEPQTVFSVSPTVRWIGVRGDSGKFRELEGVQPGWAGGIEVFSLKEQITPDKKISAEGHALFDEHDVSLKLALDQREAGFIHVGIEQWRRYYDDTGGYGRPLLQPSYALGRDLHFDTGRAWIDLGLTRPDWPLMVLGYEFQFRDGAKSTLQWGSVAANYTALTNKVYPAAKEIEERAHIIKFDLTHELGGWRIEDNARVELYDLKTSRDNTKTFTLGPLPDRVERVNESVSYVQGMNTVRVEKELREWWLFSAGYLYSKFAGNSSLEQTTLDPSAGYTLVNGDQRSAIGIVLRRDSHVFSVANLFSPADGLSAFASVQGEWTRQEGFGQVDYYFEGPIFPDPTHQSSARVEANLDQTKTMENVGVRFTNIPRTVLFAEARFEQDAIGQFEQGDPDPGQDFLRQTYANNDRRDWRTGFSTSPWRWLSLSADYRNRASDTDYDHRLDLNLSTLQPGNGYPAFIRNRALDTDEVQARLSLRLSSWCKTSLTYDRVTSDFHTTTDPADPKPSPGQSPIPGGASPGGQIFAGNYLVNRYGLNLTLTPFQRLFLYGTFTYSDSKTTTAHNDFLAIADYRGDVYTVIARASYVLNNSTELGAGYAFSRARFGQENVADGLPIGLDYTRHGLNAGVTKKWSESVGTTLRYSYYRYAEQSSGGVNDYSAHGVLLTLNYQWP